MIELRPYLNVWILQHQYTMKELSPDPPRRVTSLQGIVVNLIPLVRAAAGNRTLISAVQPSSEGEEEGIGLVSQGFNVTCIKTGTNLVTYVEFL